MVPPLKVVCPKCFKGQQVVGDVPSGGIDHVCHFCRTPFKVKPQAGPPSDLPAPREAVPMPDDLPMDRDLQPRPGDLPIAREAMPRPGDLPAPREAVPRPGDLPVSRDAVPRPGDLPVSRGAMPPPLQTTQAARAPAKTPPLGLGLDLFSDMDLGASPGAPSAPLDFSTNAQSGGSQSADTPSFTFGVPSTAPAPRPHGPPMLPNRNSGGESPGHRRSSTMPFPMPAIPTGSSSPSLPKQEPSSLSDLLADDVPSGSPPAPDMDGVSLAETPATPSFSNLLDDTAEPPAAAGRSTGSGLPISRIQVEKRNAPVNQLDLGFSLEFEGGAQAPAATSDDAIPFPGVRVANDGGAAAQETATPPNDDMLPALEPPTSRGPSTARALRPSAKKKSIPRVYFIAGGAGVLVAVLLFVLLPLLKSAPKLEVVLAPVAAELAKDTLSSYTTASSRLVEAADKIGERGNALRLKAAELLLVGATAHGTGAADVDKADRLLTIVQTETKPVARVGVVRALLAIAKGKPREADALLGDAEANPLTVGIARLAEGQPAAAVAPLRRHAVFTPGSALAHYLLGKALLSGPTAEARKEFQAALAINPSHAGASIGLARLEETAEERLAAARSLSEKKLDAGTFEQAELQWLIGQAAAELGRSLESLDALKRAVELNRHLTAASIALGEALLGEGKYAQALERLKAAGPDVEASAAGKFCMGGALIANGKTSEGLAMVESAAKERPTDPRGPFWRAFASAGRQPPDFVAAERDFREAIKRDAKFLPASLKLAALLQQQQKPEQSLTVLREAEEAGAPPAVLQLAWGDALIVAGDPAQAETVFAKALDANPQSTPARLGIAAALEAQGKVAEAKALLEDILKSAPETQGLRERLAHVCVKLGEKNDALTYFQDEMRLGQPTRGLQLAVARIALELGKLDIALSEIKKVSSQSLHDAEAAYLMGRVREAKGEAMTALQDYRRATSWSKAPEYALALGVLLVKMNKDADARVVLADAISLFEGRMARGKIALRAGDAQGALQDFQAASKMKPDLVEPILLQGLCFDRMAQLDKAEELWRAALKIDGDAAEAHYRIGRLDMDRAKPSLAIDHFRKAAASAPQDAPWRADLQFQLAQAELLTGAKAAALADFKRFLEIAPADAPTRHEANAQVARLGGGKQVERLGGVGKHFERTTSGGKKL